ncbi:hypothetical protein V8D89_009331 [Ganoderma adspersum]
MVKKSASKPSTPATKSKKGKCAAPKAIWCERNVKTLVKFLVKHKAMAGDSASFKMATFRDAAAHLAKKKYEGAEKMGAACKNKWGRLKKEFWAIQKLKKASGFSYSDSGGAGITADTEGVWEAFIKIMPVKAKGSHVFHPAHGSHDGTKGAEMEKAEEDEDEDEEEVDELDGSDDIKTLAEEDEKGSEDSKEDKESDTEARVTGGRSRSVLDTPSWPAQGTSAMQGIKTQLHNLNGLLGDFMAAETDTSGSSSQAVPPTPQRKQRAMQRAEKLETHLSIPKLVSLLNLFEKDVGAADAYLVIQGELLRKAWVDDKLNIF